MEICVYDIEDFMLIQQKKLKAIQGDIKNQEHVDIIANQISFKETSIILSGISKIKCGCQIDL